MNVSDVVLSALNYIIDNLSPKANIYSREHRQGTREPRSAMDWELMLWLLSFFSVAAALGFLIYQLMCLSDLELDYINPFDSASSINKFVLPEFIIQGSLCGLYLLTGHWIMALINAPMVYYNGNLYLKRQHLVDVTEIFSVLGKEKKYRLIKLGFYVLMFFIVIYRLVLTAVLSVLEADGSVSHGSHVESF
eukprot:c14343_g1_i1 orf=41-616(+)